LQRSLSGLLSFRSATRRSPISSANAGLNDGIPLGLLTEAVRVQKDAVWAVFGVFPWFPGTAGRFTGANK
jgi:hypothetical protein